MIFLSLWLGALSFAAPTKAEIKIAKEKFVKKLLLGAHEIATKGPAYFEAPKMKANAYLALEHSLGSVVAYPDSDLLSAVVLFGGEMAYVDSSGKVGELMLPLWKSQPHAILKYSKNLSLEKQKELRRQIKVALTHSRKK